MVAQRPNRFWKVVRIRHLEEGVAGVRRQAAEEIRAQHRRDHRAVAATRLAGNAAMTRLGQGAVMVVDPGDNLVAEVGVVLASAG